MQYHHAIIALGTSPQGTRMEWIVEHEERSLTSPGPLAGADVRTWTRAFFLALVGRDEKRVRDLVAVPVEHLRQAEGTEHPAYLYHWVGALQALINGDDRLVSYLRTAMELSDPRRPEADLPALELDLLVFPRLDLLRAFLTGEPEDFDRTLVRGLESFGEYHARSQGRQDPLAEVLPLGLLGLASLAFDRVEHDPDYRMDVRSDYLPRALLERSWFGEFPV